MKITESSPVSSLTGLENRFYGENDAPLPDDLRSDVLAAPDRYPLNMVSFAYISKQGSIQEHISPVAKYAKEQMWLGSAVSNG